MAKHFDGEDALVGGAAATEKGLNLARQAGLTDTVRSASINQHGGMYNDSKDAAVHLDEVSA